jgi:hypothetical protein
MDKVEKEVLRAIRDNNRETPIEYTTIYTSLKKEA